MLVPLLLDLGGGTAPAIIIIQPVNEAVALGGTGTFQVYATGSNLAYQWYANGRMIVGATSASYTTPPSMGGTQYYVIVYNGVSSVQSNTVLLTVILPVITTIAPAPGVTSGTVSETVFNTEKAIASALRRCRTDQLAVV